MALDREQVARNRETVLDALFEIACGDEDVSDDTRVAAGAAYLSHTWAIVDPPGGGGRGALRAAGTMIPPRQAPRPVKRS